jgi:uncharacterized protein YxjI
MESIFMNNVILVKERVGLFKAANAYDLFNAQGQKIGEVLERIPNFFVKLLKFTNYKTLLPYTVNFYDSSKTHVLTIKRPFTIIRSNISVLTNDGKPLGMYRQKFKLIKPEFHLFDPSGNLFASLKGDWKGWNFTLEDKSGVELAKITKKWAGLAKELFTSADNYVMSISKPDIPEDLRKVIFAAGIGIDMSLKERKGVLGS